MIYYSRVIGHEGKCKPAFLNKNEIDRRTGPGITGFFRNVKKYWFFHIKIGKEFHGYIVPNTKIIRTTEGLYR